MNNQARELMRDELRSLLVEMNVLRAVDVDPAPEPDLRVTATKPGWYRAQGVEPFGARWLVAVLVGEMCNLDAKRLAHGQLTVAIPAGDETARNAVIMAAALRRTAFPDTGGVTIVEEPADA